MARTVLLRQLSPLVRSNREGMGAREWGTHHDSQFPATGVRRRRDQREVPLAAEERREVRLRAGAWLVSPSFLAFMRRI